MRDSAMPKWWLRQGGALLFVIVAIVFSVKGEVYATSEGGRSQWTLDSHAKAKFYDVPRTVSKNIFVSHPPPKELMAPAIIEKIIEVGRTDFDCPAWDFGTRSQNKGLMLPLLHHGPELKITFVLNPSGSDKRIDWDGRCSSRVFSTEPRNAVRKWFYPLASRIQSRATREKHRPVQLSYYLWPALYRCDSERQ
jgi:hypothetical protein